MPQFVKVVPREHEESLAGEPLLEPAMHWFRAPLSIYRHSQCYCYGSSPFSYPDCILPFLSTDTHNARAFIFSLSLSLFPEQKKKAAAATAWKPIMDEAALRNLNARQAGRQMTAQERCGPFVSVCLHNWGLRRGS